MKDLFKIALVIAIIYFVYDFVTKEFGEKTWMPWHTYIAADGEPLTKYDNHPQTYRKSISKLKDSNFSNSYGCGLYCKENPNGSYKLMCYEYCSKYKGKIVCDKSWNNVASINW